jgi:DNA-binding NtrC family response regulator
MIKCLLIAGDKEARDVMKVGLEQAGAFEIETAEDAWAFEMVKTKPYQVVVVDTTLADGGDGFELLRRVREALPQAEILLVSRAENQSRVAGKDKKEFGVYAFVQYPVETLEFFKTIARLVDRLNAVPAATAAA